MFCPDDEHPEVYPYGITSLADKKDFLQKGDAVKFSLAVMRSGGKKRATNIAAVRKYIRAKVDSIKGQVRAWLWCATEQVDALAHRKANS